MPWCTGRFLSCFLKEAREGDASHLEKIPNSGSIKREL